jgi:hypothetical protein
MKSSKVKNSISIRLKSTLNVGDLLLANTENKSNLGVLLEQQGNQLSMLKKDGHIVKCNLNSIVFKSSEWAFRPKIKSPVQSPIILPETEALMEMHSIPSHLPGHLNAFEGAAESKRELFKQKIESVHKDLIDKKLSEISLVELCKLISGYPGIYCLIRHNSRGRICLDVNLARWNFFQNAISRCGYKKSFLFGSFLGSSYSFQDDK